MKSTELAKELGVKVSDIVASVAKLRGKVFKKGTTTLRLTAAEVAEIRGCFSGLPTALPAGAPAFIGNQDISAVVEAAVTVSADPELFLKDPDSFPFGIAPEPEMPHPQIFSGAESDGANVAPSETGTRRDCEEQMPSHASAEPVATAGGDSLSVYDDQTGAVDISALQALAEAPGSSSPFGAPESSDSDDSLPQSVEPESAPDQFPTWHGDRNTLETRHLGKSYGKKHAVRNVSFSVQTGEVVGLLGPNGAGKTTTFYMVVGVIRPDQGEILLNGMDLRSMPMYQRALNGLGYLPQEPSIFRKLTVRENLKAVLEIRWKSLKKKEDRLDIDEEVQGLLEEFSLTEFADRDGYHLSGGERRRTEIARAVALRPTFLLFDEPFAGIDPLAIIELKKMIVYLKQKGLGILITDHNVRETLSITDRAYIIKDGTVFAAGDPEALVANRDVREAYLGEDFRLS